VIWAVDDLAICCSRVKVAAVAFRANIAVFGVVQVSTIRESACGAIHLGSRGAASWAHISSLTEVTLVGRHGGVRAVMLRWALIQRVQARHARQGRVVSNWGDGW